MNNIFTVMAFELNGFIKKKSNWIYVCLIGIFSIILAISPKIFSMFDNNDEAPFFDSNYIYVYNERDDEEIIDSLNDESIFIVESEEQLKSMLDSGEVTDFFTLTNNNITYYTNSDIDMQSDIKMSSFEHMLTSLYLNKFLEENGLLNEYESINNYITNINVEKIEISDNGFTPESNEDFSENSGIESTIKFGVGYFLLILAYMTMMQYGSYASTSVGNEKSSRTMESLIYSTNVNSLIFGKVFGIFIGALIQVIIMCLMLLTGAFIAIQFGINLNLFSAEDTEILSNLVFTVINGKYVLTFLSLYSLSFLINLFLFAAFAATVSKVEEIASAISTGTLLALITFLISVMLFLNPENKFLTGLSYFPLFTPLTMFSRYSLGVTSTFDLLYAFIVSTITIVFIGWFSAKLYKIGVLLYGTKPNLITLIKLMFKKQKN